MANALGLKVCQLCAVDFTLKHFLLPLVDGMLAQDWSVTVVCSYGQYIPTLRAQGYTIKTIPLYRSLNPFLALCGLYQLTQYFRSESFDVLHVHTPIAALIGRIAGRLAGIPIIVYTAHGFYFHDQMPSWKKFIFVNLERFCGSLTNLLFCQSSEDLAEAINKKIVTPERVLLIGNGVDESRFNPENIRSSEDTRKLLGIPSDAFVVGLVGRQVREKGIVEFINAMVSLSSRHSNLWVLLVGERLTSDHQRGLTKQLNAAKSCLGNRLLCLGSRDDIPEILSVMNLFCLPSWREGMPRSIIEAMMMCKPVVATNIRGSREEVVHEHTGLLVPTRSNAHLESAIERFLLNPTWGERLGLAGRARALELYSEAPIVALQIHAIEAAFSRLRSCAL